MTEPDWRSCLEKELWLHVASHLEAAGISTVLVGGAATAVHLGGAYRSGDIDLLIDSFPPPNAKTLGRAMEEIGFRREGRHYRHPECRHLFVEFIQNSLHIGKDYRIEPQDWFAESVRVRTLSPTDCIKDPMASYVYFEARECLDQAALVAAANPIRWESVEEWAANEGPSVTDAIRELKELCRAAD